MRDEMVESRSRAEAGMRELNVWWTGAGHCPVGSPIAPTPTNAETLGWRPGKVEKGVSPRTIREVQVKNLHVPISEVVSELDGEPAENVYAQAPACGIVLDEIREVGRKPGDLTTPPEQALLFSPTERPKKIQNFNGNEQTGVAHLGSSDSPNSRSHCSGVNQRAGDRSSILCASLAA